MNTNSAARRLAVGLFLASSLLVVGCGGSTGNVTGKITYQNAPVKGGTVTFTALDTKGSAFAQIETDGTYTAKGVPVGEVKVTVDTSAFAPLKMPAGVKGKPPPGVKPPESYGGGDPSRYVAIPQQYRDFAITPLKLSVTGGDQTYNITLVAEK